MRLDKFLKTTMVLKRRTVAKEVAVDESITVFGKVVKPSYEVKVGDEINIDILEYRKVIKVLQVPTRNSIPKQSISEYIEVLSYEPKDII